MTDPLLPEISSAVCSLFSSRVVTTPISSLNLLGRVIASSRKAPLLRLYELQRFEAILETLSQPQGWDHGTITLLKNTSGVVVMNVILVKKLAQVPYDGSTTLSNPKKRKRPPVDEEAESREGSEHGHSSLEEEEIHPPKPTVSSLSNLSEEMKEIYEILQKPTAKGKLLAEQVPSFSSISSVWISYTHPAQIPQWEFRSHMPPCDQGGLYTGTTFRPPTPKPQPNDNPLRENPLSSSYPPAYRYIPWPLLVSQHMLFRTNIRPITFNSSSALCTAPTSDGSRLPTLGPGGRRKRERESPLPVPPLRSGLR